MNKTTLTQAQRYQLAYNFILSKLPAWKRHEVLGPENPNCRVYKETMAAFMKDISSLAEDTSKNIPISNVTFCEESEQKLVVK